MTRRETSRGGDVGGRDGVLDRGRLPAAKEEERLGPAAMGSSSCHPVFSGG